jgi:hypothetical protein
MSGIMQAHGQSLKDIKNVLTTRVPAILYRPQRANSQQDYP